jgi:hypothetical protein
MTTCRNAKWLGHLIKCKPSCCASMYSLSFGSDLLGLPGILQGSLGFPCSWLCRIVAFVFSSRKTFENQIMCLLLTWIHKALHLKGCRREPVFH